MTTTLFTRFGNHMPTIESAGIDQHEPSADAIPQLRVWACYPAGSSPDSVEITYDGPEPVTAGFIAEVVQSLGCPAAPAPAIEITHTDMTASTEAIERAARAADRSAR